jgi:hypothetical protein
MRHSSLDSLKSVARVTAIGPAPTRRQLKRQRLRRLASLMERHGGVVRLFSRIEHLPYRTLRDLQAKDSPLSIAYNDALLREEGLRSDKFGDAVEFFCITKGEAHHLLCDCHYDEKEPIALAVSARARRLASRMTMRDRWDSLRGTVVRLFD